MIKNYYKSPRKTSEALISNGADCQTRTDDLRITNALLYQLSQVGNFANVIIYKVYCQYFGIKFLKWTILQIKKKIVILPKKNWEEKF